MEEQGQGSSSESEEENENLVLKTLSGYSNELDDTSTDSVNSLQLALQNSLSCLICLSSIKRIQATWSCKLCYTTFHLVCIQQWAKDGVMVRNSILSEDLFPSIPLMWTCPKCRGEYSKKDIPTIYQCFCGKQIDPIPNPWILPHSCGEVCGKALKSKCGHRCLSLCHPGPCPPCPKTIFVSCYCGHSPEIPKRCGSTGWSCSRICNRTLACGLHVCEELCHAGECKDCSERVVQPCMCGKQVGEAPCNQPEWSCEEVCNKLLPCLHHLCQKKCHLGSCGECPRSGERTCPCGKNRQLLECTSEVPCCGDTCSKPLNCREHKCMRLCHVGECGPCLQVTKRKCRCGQREKLVTCSQEYLCESRCQQIRNCGRHQCRRKCCAGNCPPCEQACGRLLSCKSHKCSAPCHSGKCYPCVVEVTVSCSCNSTSVVVPCGRKRSTKPPRCTKPCQLPSSCHHSNPHRCHAGKCPPCKQVCSLPLPCKHLCATQCHSQPTIVHSTKPLAPWKKVEPILAVQPCPPCQTLISMACYGGHVQQEMPCSQVAGYSCGQMCGCLLQCGNHTCRRLCHSVINAPSLESAGEDCFTCELSCKKKRHPECPHTCPLPCHSGECPPCESILKYSCHCSSIMIYIKCSEWCAANNIARDRMKSCTSQCSKRLSCGHQCPETCHPGPCPRSGQCRRKVTVRCPCRRLKKEWRCNEQQQLQCTDVCFKAIQKQKEDVAQAAAEKAALKEQNEKEAREALERQLRPRKRKRKIVNEEREDKENPISIHMKIGLVLLAVVLVLGLGLGLLKVLI